MAYEAFWKQAPAKAQLVADNLELHLLQEVVEAKMTDGIYSNMRNLHI